jgi:hypothetical protein
MRGLDRWNQGHAYTRPRFRLTLNTFWAIRRVFQSFSYQNDLVELKRGRMYALGCPWNTTPIERFMLVLDNQV